jgi:hypothetical protein
MGEVFIVKKIFQLFKKAFMTLFPQLSSFKSSQKYSLFPFNKVKYSPFLTGERACKTNQKASFIKELSIPLIGATIKPHTDCIDAFGRIILEKFQKIITFIIKMGILLITELKILNVYIRASITQCTLAHKDSLKKCGLKNLEKGLLSGIGLRLVNSYKVMHLKRDGLLENQLRGYA